MPRYFLILLTLLLATPSWSKECDPNLYAALAGRVDDIVKLNSLATKQRRNDPAFQKAALKAVERALGHKNFNAAYIQQRAADLLAWLADIPANRKEIERLYTNFEKRIIKNREVPGESYEFFEKFMAMPFLHERAENLYRNILKTTSSSKALPGNEAFLTRGFVLITDPKLRAEVTQHKLSYLKKPFTERRPLYDFARLNPKVKELQKIPVALGVHSSLSKIARLKGAVIYDEWRLFQWVADGETIGTFRAPFHKVMKQAPQIHFEAGALLKDVEGLKKSVGKIKVVSDREALKKIKTAYLNHTNPETIPRFNNGDLSITNLELYWILTNPEFLAKTTFYEGYKEVPPARIKALIKTLKL